MGLAQGFLYAVPFPGTSACRTWCPPLQLFVQTPLSLWGLSCLSWLNQSTPPLAPALVFSKAPSPLRTLHMLIIYFHNTSCTRQGSALFIIYFHNTSCTRAGVCSLYPQLLKHSWCLVGAQLAFAERKRMMYSGCWHAYMFSLPVVFFCSVSRCFHNADWAARQHLCCHQPLCFLKDSFWNLIVLVCTPGQIDVSSQCLLETDALSWQWSGKFSSERGQQRETTETLLYFSISTNQHI